jgi:hypothetical protein
VTVLDFSAEARDLVDGSAELLDFAIGRLTAALKTSRDPHAAQAVRSLILARERLVEVSGLFGVVADELPVFLERLGQAPSARAASAPSAPAPRREDGEKGRAVSRPEKPARPEEEERTFRAWWGAKSRELADAGTAESVIGEAADRIFSDGPRGVVIRIGDGPHEEAPLRICVDKAAGRAAVFWRGSPGAESDVKPDEPLVVQDDPKGPPMTVPIERSRVTPGTAIRAAREYVETGKRPTCLDWTLVPPTPRSEREAERDEGGHDGRAAVPAPESGQ